MKNKHTPDKVVVSGTSIWFDGETSIKPATPLPWKAPFLEDGDSEITITDIEQEFGIAVVHEKYSESVVAAKHNAAYIVTACNLFPELVEMAEELNKLIESDELKQLLKECRGEK